MSFDADLVVDKSLNVTSGGFPAENAGGPSWLIGHRYSQNLIGYLQLSPDLHSPFPATLAELFNQTGPLSPAVSCTIEAGHFNNTSGTVLRCSAFEVNIISESCQQFHADARRSALLYAGRRRFLARADGAWVSGLFTDPALLPIFRTITLFPLVRPATSNDYWYIADVDATCFS